MGMANTVSMVDMANMVLTRATEALYMVATATIAIVTMVIKTTTA